MTLGFAQRNTKYGQYPYKMLPVGLSYYAMDSHKGFRLSIENAFYEHQRERVEGIQPRKSLWQVVGLFNTSALWSSDNNETTMFGAGIQLGGRRSFSNTLKVEAFTGYQFLQRRNADSTVPNTNYQLWDITIGVGQDFKMVKESFLTWYLRPGLNFEIQNSGLSFFSTSLQLGIDYRFENIHLIRWKNPWFKSKDKALQGREFERPKMEIDESREDKKTRRRRLKIERKKLRKKRKAKLNYGKVKYKSGRR